MRLGVQMQTENLYDRFDSFTSLVARRIEVLGRDPNAVLIVCRQRLILAAMTLPSGAPVAFMAYMRSALQTPTPLDQLADQFVTDWLAQIRIDERYCA
jgi:hypothetical protein